MLKLNPIITRRVFRPFPGEQHGFISSAIAMLRCNAGVDNCVSTRALSSITNFLNSQSPSSFHSSSPGHVYVYDDEFSELGAPVPSPLKAATTTTTTTTASCPQLITVKTDDPYLRGVTRKAKDRGKASAVPSQSSTSLRDVSSKLKSRKRTVSSEALVKLSEPTIHSPDDKEDAKVPFSIRITNINSETTDSAIHSVCMNFGTLEGMVRTKVDAVDALYRVKSNKDIQHIVQKLNDTAMNDHQWSAKLHPVDSSLAVVSKQTNANCNFGLVLSRQLAELRREVTMKTVCIEDLEYLHGTLFYLESCPDSSSRISKNV